MSGTLGATTHEYTYDADGNRLTDKTGGVTTTSTYDRADQLKTRKVGSGSTINFAYDARGNLTANAETGSTTTAYGYDWADRLVSIDPPGASNTAAFTFDALGRNATRTVNGTLDSTYSYLGTTETVVRLAVNGGATTNAALDALGQRIAVKAGDASFFGWLLPDLHGNVAAALSQDETTVSDGLRYDGYGQLTAIYPTGGTGVSAKWRYQGRLLVSTSGNADLYDAGARSYSPGLGAFTQLDSVMGGAANPLSMNRYLYAEANPATLIDPTGHRGKLGGCGQDCYPGAGTTVVTDPGPSTTGGGSSTGGGGGGGTFTPTPITTTADDIDLCALYGACMPWQSRYWENMGRPLVTGAVVVVVAGSVYLCVAGGCELLAVAGTAAALDVGAGVEAGGVAGLCVAVNCPDKFNSFGNFVLQIGGVSPPGLNEFASLSSGAIKLERLARHLWVSRVRWTARHSAAWADRVALRRGRGRKLPAVQRPALTARCSPARSLTSRGRSARRRSARRRSPGEVRTGCGSGDRHTSGPNRW